MERQPQRSDSAHSQSAGRQAGTRAFHPPTPVQTPAQTTHESIRSLIPFGLLPITSGPTRGTIQADPSLIDRIARSRLTLLTGYSGSGKSTLLGAIGSMIPHTRFISESDLVDPRPDLPIINLFDRPIRSTIALLSAVGLAEPRLWALPASVLSAGEQARLTIARLVDAAGRDPYPNNTIITLDELATPLDRLTARSLCNSLTRLIRSTPSLRVIAASAHEDLPSFLDTDLLIDARDQRVMPSRYQREEFWIEPGTMRDYASIKHHHYIAPNPASVVRVDRAMRRCPVSNTPILAAVLVVAHPTLNASWRDRAWPGRYTRRDKAANAHRINREIRRLSRVVVEPRSRALGIATALVRNYLSNPLTPATEALAAMGAVSPFFKRAGMTQYRIPLPKTDLRLLDALTHLNQTPESLLDPSPGHHPMLTRELRTWARARSLDPEAPGLASHAAFRLLTKPRAYTHADQRGAL